MDSQWQEEVQIIKALQNKYPWVILDSFFSLFSLFCTSRIQQLHNLLENPSAPKVKWFVFKSPEIKSKKESMLLDIHHSKEPNN